MQNANNCEEITKCATEQDTTGTGIRLETNPATIAFLNGHLDSYVKHNQDLISKSLHSKFNTLAIVPRSYLRLAYRI